MAGRVMTSVPVDHGNPIPESGNPDWGKVFKNELRKIDLHLFAGGN